MKCPSKKLWLLFFYKDLSKNEVKDLQRHLDSCNLCQKEYADINNFLCAIGKEKINIEQRELNAILDNVRERSKPASNIFIRLSDGLNYFIQNLRLGLAYHPQVAFIVLFILLGAILIPLGLNKRQQLASEDIIEIQTELAWEENDDLDIFYDTPFDDLSGYPISTSNYS
ncbi:MAG: hypothetical protein Q8O30_13105 [Candidatus Omnitrophota bacterium]|nr:hypothetical protein [Candidatus Omnitrophota bacterium]